MRWVPRRRTDHAEAASSPERKPHRLMNKVAALKEYRKTKGAPMGAVLLAIILLISALGLIANAVAVQQTMEEVTYSSVDDDLGRALNSWAVNLDVFNSLGVTKVNTPPNDFYLAWIYPDGSSTEIKGRNGRSTPDLTQIFVGTGAKNVPSSSDSEEEVQWRAIAQQRNGVTVIVAKDISQEQLILQRLAIGQAIIGLAVLVLIAMVAYAVIQRTLRPLKKVEETATAIAAGDLDRRVPQWPINTEVGALGASLNVMLERLQASIVELQEKEEQMRRFVGDASHELRTPLTSVKGYSELYRSGATTDANLVVEKIEAEAERMSVLVEDLLALTRAEGARYEKAQVDLLELNLAVAASIRAAYPTRRIEVRATTNSLPMVCGDASKLHQVFTNLVVNAVTHGGPEAEVTIQLFDDHFHDQPCIRIDVHDNGVGLSEKDAAHIFERFYRADISRTRATGGSGLGLAITKSLVEAHDGHISVHSTLGEGTTFSVYLPTVECAN